MTNLAQYTDETVLSTDEVATWLRISRKTVLRMGIPLVNLPGRGRFYLAGEVKRVLGGRKPRAQQGTPVRLVRMPSRASS
jgi:hypothetical protein